VQGPKSGQNAVPLVALLDTNVWVSAFLKPTGPPGQIVAAWRREEFSVVTSLSQLGEIAEVLAGRDWSNGFGIPTRVQKLLFD